MKSKIRKIRYNANEKSLARYLLGLTELKIKYLELSVKAFGVKNKLFKDEMDRLFKNRVLELENKKIEILTKQSVEFKFKCKTYNPKTNFKCIAFLN